MIWPTAVMFTLALLAAMGGLNRFLSLRSQPSVLFTLVEVIAIYIPISIVFLLPLDILSTNNDADSWLYINSKYILMLWKFDYWSAFLLMWAILPFVQEYYRSGEFTPTARIKDSIKSNLRFQLIVGTVGIIGLTYFFLRFGFTFQTFKDLLIALSHSFSLMLSLWLMSHGLITIPRRRWNDNINLENQLENLYHDLPKLYDELNESLYNYKDICSIIISLQTIPDIDKSVFKNEVEQLASEVPPADELQLRNHVRTTQYTSITQLSHSTLSKLHRVLKSETTNYRSALFEFNKAKLNILRLEDIVSSKATRSLHFRFGSNFIKNGRLSYIYHVFILPTLGLLYAVALFGMSFIIVESEVLHSTKLSIINTLMVSSKLSPTLKFIISFVVLAYMVLCSLISLTRIKLFKMYHLFPKESNPVSVVFFTMYSNRLTVPLSYNFLTLLQTAKVHSQFDDLLGSSIKLSVLGGFFNTTLPRLIIIPIMFATLNVFDRLKKKISFDYFDAFDSDGDDADDLTARAKAIREGKSIIQRETNLAGRQVRMVNDGVLPSNDEDADEPLLGNGGFGFRGLAKWFTPKSGSSDNVSLETV